jgi:hypothetical protein
LLTETLANHGIIAGFESGTGNYALYDCQGIDTGAQVMNAVVVDDSSTIMHEEGTIDFTDINSIVLGHHNTTGNNNRIVIDQFHTLNVITVIGGHASLPASWQTSK